MAKSGVKQDLLERRDKLSKRLDKIRSDRRRAGEPLDPDFADQATQRENDETLDFLDTRIRAELADIDATIARVGTEAYGVCTRCGDAIPAARLELLPTTSTCSPCAAAVDAQGPEQS